MKTTQDKLRAKIRVMLPEELQDFAFNVVAILYLNKPAEWEGDTIENVGAEVDAAGLHPDKVALFNPIS